MTFNSFLSHVHKSQRTYSTRQLLQYFLLRVVCIFVLLEVWLHSFYVFSLTNSDEFTHLEPYTIAFTSYYTLVAIWLKFTAIWRFFRCWALLDGVEPPENMQRCVSNNYSMQAFWRGWHRSFNRWLVRYIYIPLGGGGGGGGAAVAPAVGVQGATIIPSSPLAFPHSTSGSLPAPPSKVLALLQQCGNVFLTFSFVAFWHDRTMQLLAWGWLIALLFIPELSASALFNLKSTAHIKRRWYWRHLQGVGASLSIFMMMVANLIGYSVGIDGTGRIIEVMLYDGGIQMFAVVFAAFFSASMIMFECRDSGITVE
jgi:D-alanyl-lipoteichoic acid acyltransferase DltB (MBOAT superfamily)